MVAQSVAQFRINECAVGDVGHHPFNKREQVYILDVGRRTASSWAQSSGVYGLNTKIVTDV